MNATRGWVRWPPPTGPGRGGEAGGGGGGRGGGATSPSLQEKSQSETLACCMHSGKPFPVSE